MPLCVCGGGGVYVCVCVSLCGHSCLCVCLYVCLCVYLSVCACMFRACRCVPPSSDIATIEVSLRLFPDGVTNVFITFLDHDIVNQFPSASPVLYNQLNIQ